MMTTNDPRKAGREAIQNSVELLVWNENGTFCETLKSAIEGHPILSHPILAQLEGGQHDLDAQRFFHLEFRHAFAQIFTDALIQAMVTSAQMESSLGAMGKVASRFLLQLNVLDELGFVPHDPLAEEYAGNPGLSHYVQFDATLHQLGLSKDEIDAYQPSAASRACRATFEDQYTDHVALTAVMAVSETVFGKFSGPWSVSVGTKTDIDVSAGYHSIHIEKDGQFIEDDHSEDAWIVFQQAITAPRYKELSIKVIAWLDTWVAFLDSLAGVSGDEQSLSAQTQIA